MLSGPASAELRGALGWHPWALEADRDIHDHQQRLEQEWSAWQAQQLTPVAVGEFGLDRSPRWRAQFELQQAVFRLHLEWSQRLKIPVILHLVKADGAALELLRERPPVGGVIHGFASHSQTLGPYAELGLSFSFGGALLEREKVQRSLRDAPLDRVMFETDAPSGTVALRKVVRAASQLLGKSVEWCWSLHRDNCRRILNLT